jgi:DNA-binding NarL/FixJ family response regulator
MIRLYLIDDHALFREGLERLLISDQEHQIVGSVGTLEEAERDVLTLAIDVLILDFELNEQAATPFVQKLRNSGFAGRILVVTAGLSDRDAVELIRLGVSGIFHKQRATSELRRIIQEVHEGRVLIDQRYLQKLVQSADSHQHAFHRPRLEDSPVRRGRAREQGDCQGTRHLRKRRQSFPAATLRQNRRPHTEPARPRGAGAVPRSGVSLGARPAVGDRPSRLL